MTSRYDVHVFEFFSFYRRLDHLCCFRTKKPCFFSAPHSGFHSWSLIYTAVHQLCSALHRYIRYIESRQKYKWGLNFFAVLLLPVLLRDLLAFVFDPRREEEFFFCCCLWLVGGKWRHNAGTPGTLFCGDSSCWMCWRPPSGTLNWTLTPAGPPFFCKYCFFLFISFCLLESLLTGSSGHFHCCLPLSYTWTSLLTSFVESKAFFCVDAVALSKKKHVVSHQLCFFTDW